jgi:hypothetical protein
MALWRPDHTGRPASAAMIHHSEAHLPIFVRKPDDRT